MIAGAAQTVRQYLAAGLLDELLLEVGDRRRVDGLHLHERRVVHIHEQPLENLLSRLDGSSAAGAELSYAEAVGT